MIGLDTNVLVRYIMQDDAAQSKVATDLIEALRADAPGFIPLVVVIELVWVLSSCYGLRREQLVTALETLLRTAELVVENAEVVWRAVRNYRAGGGDFADCLLQCSAAQAGCERTVTFDRGAARHCGMVLLG